MSPNVQAVVIPLTVVAIFFSAFYLNIQRAKTRVSYWRPGSSYWFIRSNGLVGIEARAMRVWMKELGYEAPEALIIAACQGRAIMMVFAGFFALIATASILEDHGEQSAPPVVSAKVPAVKVRPQLSAERRDGSGDQLSDERTSGNQSDGDQHKKIRTFQVRQGSDAMNDAYRHFVPTTPVPAQSE